MNWVETPESSNIARFSFDEDSGTLFIEFKKGGTYQYFDVPQGIVEQFKVASSKGQYFAQSIKGVFRYAKA